MPTSGRWPSIIHANSPASAGITQNSTDAERKGIADTYAMLTTLAQFVQRISAIDR